MNNAIKFTENGHVYVNVSLQQTDGSWGSDAYLTAIAMQALRYTGLSLKPLIFKDSFEQ